MLAREQVLSSPLTTAISDSGEPASESPIRGRRGERSTQCLAYAERGEQTDPHPFIYQETGFSHLRGLCGCLSWTARKKNSNAFPLLFPPEERKQPEAASSSKTNPAPPSFRGTFTRAWLPAGKHPREGRETKGTSRPNRPLRSQPEGSGSRGSQDPPPRGPAGYPGPGHRPRPDLTGLSPHPPHRPLPRERRPAWEGGGKIRTELTTQTPTAPAATERHPTFTSVSPH